MKGLEFPIPIAIDTCVLHKFVPILKEMRGRSAQSYFEDTAWNIAKDREYFESTVNKISDLFKSEGKRLNKDSLADTQILARKFRYYINKKKENVYVDRGRGKLRHSLYRALTMLILQSRNEFPTGKFWSDSPVIEKEKERNRAQRKYERELDELIEETFKLAGKKYDYLNFDLNDIVEVLSSNKPEVRQLQNRFITLISKLSGKECDFSQVGKLFEDRKIVKQDEVLDVANSVLKEKREFKVNRKRLNGERIYMLELLRLQEMGIIKLNLVGENLDELISHLKKKSSIRITEENLARLLSIFTVKNIEYSYPNGEQTPDKIEKYIMELANQYMSKAPGQKGGVMPSVKGSLNRTSDPICMAESNLLGMIYVTLNVKDHISSKKNDFDDVRQHIIKTNQKNGFATSAIPVTMQELLQMLEGKSNLIQYMPREMSPIVEFCEHERVFSVVENPPKYAFTRDEAIRPSSQDTLVACQEEFRLKPKEMQNEKELIKDYDENEPEL